jgi:hypothetical protein
LSSSTLLLKPPEDACLRYLHYNFFGIQMYWLRSQLPAD